MERAVALKKLAKLLGKQLGYRIDPKAASKEEREAARDSLKPAAARRDAIKEQWIKRRVEVLGADSEYQRLSAEYKSAGDNYDRLASITRHHKITVGIRTSLFFHVKAEGDSWEEVIDKLQQKNNVTA